MTYTYATNFNTRLIGVSMFQPENTTISKIVMMIISQSKTLNTDNYFHVQNIVITQTAVNLSKYCNSKYGLSRRTDYII